MVTGFRWHTRHRMHLTVAMLLAAMWLQASAADQDHSARELYYIPAAGSPFYFSTSLATESVTNLSGGVRDGTAFDALLHTGLAMNGSVIGLPEGGRFRVSTIAVASSRPSLRYVGDVQGVSNIAAEPAVRVYDAWFRQDFRHRPLQLRAGIIDANEYFDVTESAANLLNSSFGISGSVSANAPFSIYPKPGYGMMARWGKHPARLLFGVFQGMPDARSGALHQGSLAIGEWQIHSHEGYVLKLGGWNCNCNPDGNRMGTTHGVYGSFAVPFSRVGTEPVVFFIRAGISGGAAVAVPRSYATGFNVNAPFSDRKNDIFSAGITRVDFRNHQSETSYEMTYIWQASNGFLLQPDLQYVSHPGGVLHNTWVLTLRFRLDYDTHFQ